MFFNYTKYIPIIYQLQNSNYFFLSKKIQNTLNVFLTRISNYLYFDCYNWLFIIFPNGACLSIPYHQSHKCVQRNRNTVPLLATWYSFVQLTCLALECM